jgi:hypothetical protein
LGKAFTSMSGKRRIHDSFDVILPKVLHFLDIIYFRSLILSCRTHKFRRPRSSRLRISGKPSQRRSSEPQLSLCGAIAELWLSQSGKTSILVTHNFHPNSRMTLTGFI